MLRGSPGDDSTRFGRVRATGRACASGLVRLRRSFGGPPSRLALPGALTLLLLAVALPAAVLAAAGVSLSPPSQTVTAGQTATLTATVLNSDNQPVMNEDVTFTVAGANSGAGATLPTGAQGTATFQYAARNVGTDTVTATELVSSAQPAPGGAAPALAATATVTVVSGAPARVVLSPASQTVSVGGTATVTATAVTAAGQPVANQPISFIVSGANTVARQVVNTSSAYTAAFSYVPSKAGTDTVTAFVDAAGSGVLVPSDPQATATTSVSGTSSGPPGQGTTGPGGPPGCVAPSVAITSDQGRAGFFIGDVASVSIRATAPSGLSRNPSASHMPLDTSKQGTFSLSRTATATCGSSTTASFRYTVIPEPVLGKTVNLEAISGKVYVKLPGGTRSTERATAAASTAPGKGIGFIPIEDARQVPVGTIVDTRAGTAMIASATSVKNKLYTGSFFAGLFKILQNRRQKGLTSLDIMNTRPRTAALCTTLGKSAVVAAANPSARAAARRPKRTLSKKILGLLSSKDTGVFTVRGNYAAATVRGTQFTVTDRCDGTLTRVTRGIVSVSNLRTRRTVTLHAGQSYLAPGPPI
ncbi:MAG TPA: Ig-like domain-containing protein [Solirubrobacteraceae bacterium]|jgi:hypothetical protein|nr:Ig-like domain-containing protein [Solirubrobacteraceae bacterium]